MDMPCSPRRPCKKRSIASMMSTTTANPPHNIGVPTECILFSLHIKNKNGYGQKTIAVSFLCIDLAFRQGLTYNHEGCPATGCGFARIVMTIHRRRSYSPLQVTKYVRPSVSSMVCAVSLHSFTRPLQRPRHLPGIPRQSDGGSPFAASPWCGLPRGLGDSLRYLLPDGRRPLPHRA